VRIVLEVGDHLAGLLFFWTIILIVLLVTGVI